MRRLSGWLLPIGLALIGVSLIIAGQFAGRPAGPSLAPIPDPTPSAVAEATPSPMATPTDGATEAPSTTPAPTPTPTPLPDDVVATQLEVPSVGINVVVRKSTSDAIDDFPDDCCAFILQTSEQPGRNTNAFVFAHAVNWLFKPLWNVQLGAEVKVLMSDGQVLRYVVTEIRPNVPCPDPDSPPHPDPPLALQGATDCEEGVAWLAPTGYERLTLQTSQGFNRNWGELIVVAEPAG